MVGYFDKFVSHQRMSSGWHEHKTPAVTCWILIDGIASDCYCVGILPVRVFVCFMLSIQQGRMTLSCWDTVPCLSVWLEPGDKVIKSAWRLDIVAILVIFCFGSLNILSLAYLIVALESSETIYWTNLTALPEWNEQWMSNFLSQTYYT